MLRHGRGRRARNLLTQARAFDNAAWALTTASVAQDRAGPGGDATGWTYTEAGTGSNITNAAAVPIVPGRVYTASGVFRVGATAAWARLTVSNANTFTNTARVYFNLNTLARGTLTTSGSGIQALAGGTLPLGGGWVRVWLTFIMNTATTCFVALCSAAADNNGARANSGVCSIGVWHMQLAPGTHPGPLLATTTQGIG